jgi:hypothetical protein
VQVLELAEMQGSDDPFTAVSGGFTASAANQNDDPFGLPAVSATTATSAVSDLEDSIPF